MSGQPEVIATESELEEILTRPGAALLDAIKTYSSPLLILGAGGKMGPTLAVLAQRAAEAAGHRLDVVAVSRFGDTALRERLEAGGVKTVGCELLDAQAVAALPDSEDILYLAGLKFGTAQNPAATWAMNTLVPARVCERYPRSRMVALSTGNVYPLSEASRGGSTETDALTPLGEYANTAVARERIFEFHSRRNGTALALLRLFYAVELRYGVLADIARKVHAGAPIALGNGSFNCIWQGDANEMILRSLPLAASPPSVWNLCRPEIFSVRQVAMRCGELLGREPVFRGSESATALLGNSAPLCTKLGSPAHAECRRIATSGVPIPVELLRRAGEVTDCNAAFFDAVNNYSGCIPGLHEVLRRQGLLEGIWCLDPGETLSPGQREEIDRVCRAYPHLSDDRFVEEHRDVWLA